MKAATALSIVTFSTITLLTVVVWTLASYGAYALIYWK
jgi:hypothetical protein